MNKYYKQILAALKKNEDETRKELIRVYAKALMEIKRSLSIAAADDLMSGGDGSIKIERLLSLQRQMESAIYNLTNNNKHEITAHGAKMYRDKYYGTMYQAEMELGFGLNYPMINEKKLEAAINMPIGNIDLATRLGYKGEKLNKVIRENLVRAALTGESYSTTARRLAEQLESSYKDTMRIVRTEGGRLSTTATLDSLEELSDLGIEYKKQWLATLDSDTRDEHAELDGQIVGEDENFEIGIYEAPGPHMFGYPEMDINCRCDVISVIEGVSNDFRKDNITKEIVEYVTYEEWLESAID